MIEFLAQNLERSEAQNWSLEQLLFEWLRELPDFAGEANPAILAHSHGLVGNLHNVERLLDHLCPDAAMVLKRGFASMAVASCGHRDSRTPPFVAIGMVSANVLLAAGLRYFQHRTAAAGDVVALPILRRRA